MFDIRCDGDALPAESCSMKRPIMAMTVPAAALSLSAPLHAEHANPWATEDDTVLAKNHDTNQGRSVDMPGADEMRGTMTKSARGKTETNSPGSGAGGGEGGIGRRSEFRHIAGPGAPSRSRPEQKKHPHGSSLQNFSAAAS